MNLAEPSNALFPTNCFDERGNASNFTFSHLDIILNAIPSCRVADHGFLANASRRDFPRFVYLRRGIGNRVAISRSASLAGSLCKAFDNEFGSPRR
jgi:hypothetical protein